MTLSPCIILAPHLEFPLRNGGDIYIERLGRHLSSHRAQVLLLGSNILVRYEMGEKVCSVKYMNKFRSNNLSAFRTLIFNSHYLVEKFLTPVYKDMADNLISNHPTSLFICSYVTSASLFTKSSVPQSVVIVTQNDEVAWFKHQRLNTKNLLKKMVAKISENWLLSFLPKHVGDYVFAHITEEDSIGYENLIPGHQRLIIPAGVDIKIMNKPVEWDGKIRLLFCGSLSAEMNYHALAYFAEEYWPVLLGNLDSIPEVWIAGSQPTSSVRQLCEKHEWILFANLSDESLQDLYTKATFSFLTFPYTVGAKLKLLTSLANGLPVLATTNMNYLPEQCFLPNLYSDNPIDWLVHLKKTAQNGVSLNERLSCKKFAANYSWKSIVSDMDDSLRKMGL